MSMGWLRQNSAIEISCLVDIEETADSFHAHAIPQDIDIRPGDVVMVHDAPTGIAFGDRFACLRRATVTRAGWLKRHWTEAAGIFDLTELYEVGFSAKEVR